MDIHKASRSYEAWLGRHTTVVRADLHRKHRRMAESPFVFLRGTFYRWIAQWPTVCSSLLDAPAILAVGDLHLENFGTWRDIEGRLVWGVNDVDEACRLPYTHDLVRLAASALLAVREGHLGLSAREACAAILDGYTASIARGGRPIVLAERRQWLRQLALNDLRDPVAFWEAARSWRPATVPVPHEALRSLMPAPGLKYQVFSRTAGVGSLGRPRFVALAEWGGGLVAREAKALIPSAVFWARGETVAETLLETILARAVRVPDPYFAVKTPWIVRRLAPDCSRIELDELPKRRDEAKLLRAMGWETANVHLGTPRARIAKDFEGRPRRWLERAAAAMSEAVISDWQDWATAR